MAGNVEAVQLLLLCGADKTIIDNVSYIVVMYCKSYILLPFMCANLSVFGCNWTLCIVCVYANREV